MSVAEGVRRVASGGEFVLGVDFDGTIAPIVDHPDLAVTDPTALELLRDLALRRQVLVAVVSGRTVADLRDRLGEIPDAILIGEHGNDTGTRMESDPLIAEAATMLEELIDGSRTGVVVEVKRRSVAFHYRGLAEDEAAGYLERIRAWATGHQRIDVMEGKKVIELSTATHTKGDAIIELAGERPIIYLGDDTTDETVFRSMRPGDVGIKVGEGPTSAEYRVENVAGVLSILELIDLASA